MNNIIKNKRLNSTFIISPIVVGIVFVSFSLLPQQSYAEDYKLNIIIKNEDEDSTKVGLSE
jgi:hypothetical protein